MRGGLTNQTGEKVNEMSALGISTVYSAISLLADGIALLQLKLLDMMVKLFYRQTKVLEKPNQNQTIFK